MADSTAIEWCDATFNPWWGCEKVSPGCAHCYAEGISNHRSGRGNWGAGHGFRFFGDKHWAEPLKWARNLPGKLGRRPRVFCASMADVFEDRPELNEPRGRLFGLIAATPELDWLVLTKRPEHALAVLDGDIDSPFWASVWEHAAALAPEKTAPVRVLGRPQRFVLDNVWMGVSIENARFTWRADVLREIPAAVRFISAEPLLGSLYPAKKTWRCSMCGKVSHTGEMKTEDDYRHEWHRQEFDLTDIDWVIVGGESGPGARPFHLEHACEIIDAALDQCGTCSRVMGRRAVAHASQVGDSRPEGICDRHTAVFVKQLGAKPLELFDDLGIGVATQRPLRLSDRKGGDMSEWPADLCIREFPRSAVPV